MFSNFKNFSKTELFIYLILIALIFLSAYFYYYGNIVKIRDEQRKRDLLLLKSELDDYFRQNNTYPLSNSWICIDNSDIQKQISSNIILRDPLFSEDSAKYCYRYKTSKDGKAFKLYCILEGKKEIYEISSKGGENLFTALPSEDPWLSSNFEFRKKIKILPFQKLNSDLDNFPFLISLLSEDFKNKNLSNNKIVFFDPEKKEIIPSQIISINNQTGNILAFLNLDNVPFLKEKNIYIYYGDTEFFNNKSYSLFNDNFACVFHFDEINLPLDATKNNITLLVANNAVKQEEGKIYKSLLLNGKSVLSLQGLDEDKLLDGFTIQMWIFPKGEIGSSTESIEENHNNLPMPQEEDTFLQNNQEKNNTAGKIFGLDGNEYKEKQIFILQDKNSNTLGLYLSFYVTSTNLDNSTSSQKQEEIIGSLSFKVNDDNFVFPQNIKLNEWSFISLSFSKDKIILFVNEEKKEISYSFNDKKSQSSESYFFIGKSSSSLEENGFSGLLDELQISKGTLPEDWILFTFENQNNPAQNIQLEKEERF